MKRYRLNIALLIACIVISASGATLLFINGLWAQGCLGFIVTALCIFALWHLQSRLIGTMSAFVNALEMNDTTTRIILGGDHELLKMSESMNRISDIYSENMRELQTRKLYYDRVLRIMTHEMRNGITPIVSIAADMVAKPERYQGRKFSEASHLLLSQAEGIHRFLDSYYKLTHLPEPKLEPVKAGYYFHSLKRLFKAELDNRNVTEETISYTVPEDMILNIDTSLINQALINLLRNALDSLPSEGGKVEIILTVSDSHPYLTIKDNGSGMTQDTIHNLFQPFYTTKPNGSGVGLSITRQIIQKHGGEIRIQSQPNKGTSVFITLST
ncbi:MAG: HAMP domain-containing histidine kinase [Muribaculaceae bacterium]|nr:HAMP domain-containing histidine kinase [Muribaculaceae bacterium]